MPAFLVHFPDDFTREEVRAVKDELAHLFLEHGYAEPQRFGPGAGERGRLWEGLLAIISGEVALVLLPDEQRSAFIEFCRQTAAGHPDALVAEAAESVAEALEAAVRREQD